MHLLPRVALAGVVLAWAGVASAQTPCTADSCADLRFEIRPMQTAPWAGAPMKWTARAWNQGPAAARAKVEIPLPAGPGTYWTCVALHGAACDTPPAGQGGGIVNNVTLPMGGEVQYQIDVVSDPCARGPNDGRLSGKVTALDK